MTILAKLKVLEGSDDNVVYKMTTPVILIGRSEQCDIFLPSEKVSRKHADIEFIEGKLYLKDLGSTNGTYLNGEKLRKGSLKSIKNGDKIGLGNYLFKIEIPKIKLIY